MLGPIKRRKPSNITTDRMMVMIQQHYPYCCVLAFSMSHAKPPLDWLTKQWPRAKDEVENLTARWLCAEEHAVELSEKVSHYLGAVVDGALLQMHFGFKESADMVLFKLTWADQQR